MNKNILPIGLYKLVMVSRQTALLPLHVVQHGNSSRDLVDTIFSERHVSNNRCILTPKNETDDAISTIIIESLPGTPHVYESADYFGEHLETQANLYFSGLLNTVLQPCMLQHILSSFARGKPP